MCERQKYNGIPEIKGNQLIIGDKIYTLEEFPGLPAELEKAGGLGGQKREVGILNYRGVPEQFLPYALYHESVCGFINKSGKCVDSIPGELELVPENIKDEYLNWRISFFKGMLNYAKAKSTTPDDYYNTLNNEMQASLNYLREINIQRNNNHIQNGVKCKIEDLGI